jgi:hypothetical protein
LFVAGTIGAEAIWQLLEQLSNFFYDPEIFWGVPLIIALLWALVRRHHR